MTSNCINYDCEPLGTHEIGAACSGIIMGGSSDWVILDCESGVDDPTSSTQINAAISAGKAKVVRNVKSGFGKPSPVTVDSQTSCGVPSILTYDWTGTIKDGNISSTNIDFWNALATGRDVEGILMFECADADETQYVTWINAKTNFQGGRVLPDVNTQAQIFDFEFKWRSKKSPQRYTAPTGVTGLNA